MQRKRVTCHINKSKLGHGPTEKQMIKYWKENLPVRLGNTDKKENSKNNTGNSKDILRYSQTQKVENNGNCQAFCDKRRCKKKENKDSNKSFCINTQVQNKSQW